MEVVDLPIERLRGAPWNPNRMDDAALGRLRASLHSYGLVGPLVIRPMGDGAFEVLSGNQRLEVLRELGYTDVPCVEVALGDAHARLLSQALNYIRGEDDLGLRADLLRQVLASVPEPEVLTFLPETKASLNALISVSQEDIATYLQVWQQAQSARLHHMTFQLVGFQLEVVHQALEHALGNATAESSGANRRGTALTAICRAYLDSLEGNE